MEEARSDSAVLLPADVDGWHLSKKEQAYDRETLYEYIDGGAELYLSYQFKSVITRTYSRQGQPDIVLDLFDMGTSEDAFGVFSHSRETVDSTFGQGSQYTEGLLLFWKNNYYVSVLASPETAQSKKAVFELAKRIDESIPHEGPLPGIVALLPKQDLAEESIRYFRHYVWLNSHYYIADENILHIDKDTQAVLAKYGKKGKRHILLLVQYANIENAKLGFKDFAKHYLPELTEDAVVRIEDGTWIGCQLNKRLLIVVFNAPTRDEALKLMDAVSRGD